MIVLNEIKKFDIITIFRGLFIIYIGLYPPCLLSKKNEPLDYQTKNWEKLFDSTDSVKWKPVSIIPLKIENTDPTSGALVLSNEIRYYKDGTVFNKDLVELFYFDMDRKMIRKELGRRGIVLDLNDQIFMREDNSHTNETSKKVA